MVVSERGIFPVASNLRADVGYIHTHWGLLPIFDKGLKYAKTTVVRPDEEVERILDCKFTKTPGFNDNWPIDVEDDIPAGEIRLLRQIEQLSSEGRSMHIRIVNKNRSGTGNPMVYILDPEDKWSELVFPDEVVLEKDAPVEKVITLVKKYGLEMKKHGGGTVRLEEDMHIDVFHQDASAKRKAQVLELDGDGRKNNKIKEIAMGGGFTIMVADVKGDEVIFYYEIVLGDGSPRHLDNKDPKELHKFPQSSGYITCKYKNGILEIDEAPMTLGYALGGSTKDGFRDCPHAVVNVDRYSRYVVQQFIKQDAEPITKLAAILMDINPMKGENSFDVLFNLKEGGTLKIQAMSFDGFETVKEWTNGREITSQNGGELISMEAIIFQGIRHLNLAHYLTSDFSSHTERDVMLRQQGQIAKALISLRSSKNLSKEIKKNIESHISGLEFTKKVTGSVALARMLKMVGVSWKKNNKFR